MEESVWALIAAAVAMVVIGLVRRWYRQRVAARLADQMLSDVIKGKDAFRR
jgi:beta-lactamase regulating signal transducer with metallopeptidase domain